MRALDTNVLVRFLVDDDADQCRRARSVAAQAKARGERLFVSDVVICELVWVLARAYKVKRAPLIVSLRSLLHADGLAFADSSALGRALDAFERGKGDFADYVIREHGRAAGCAEVFTFDTAIQGDPGFVEP